MRTWFQKLKRPLISKKLVKGKGVGGEVKSKPTKMLLCFCNVLEKTKNVFEVI